MHDYSRDIMLANAQTEMEGNLARMELAKKVAITKQNNDKANSTKKQNDDLGYMFLPSSVNIIQEFKLLINFSLLRSLLRWWEGKHLERSHIKWKDPLFSLQKY